MDTTSSIAAAALFLAIVGVVLGAVALANQVHAVKTFETKVVSAVEGMRPAVISAVQQAEQRMALLRDELRRQQSQQQGASQAQHKQFQHMQQTHARPPQQQGQMQQPYQMQQQMQAQQQQAQMMAQQQHAMKLQKQQQQLQAYAAAIPQESRIFEPPGAFFE